MACSLEKAILWIEDLYFSKTQQFEVKYVLMMHLFLTDMQFLQNINGLNWSGVDYRDVFMSCLDSDSDGTHSLQRIHWWTSDEIIHFSKSVLTKKQTNLYLGRPEGE